MLVRVLTATDMPVIEAVALSNADNKKWLGLDKSRFPVSHGAMVGLIGRLIALDYWRFFGAFDDAGKTFGYTIVESVLPVADYNSKLVVAADGDKKSTVTWSGSFKHAEKSDDKTATDTITSVYSTGRARSG